MAAGTLKKDAGLDLKVTSYTAVEASSLNRGYTEIELVRSTIFKQVARTRPCASRTFGRLHQHDAYAHRRMLL
jgi:hypothetical protein